MESALGANFSDVRIHVGPEASAIGAIAFTWGSDIHFAPGQYNPHTPHGQSLLGHELTHVVQQRAGRWRIRSARCGGGAGSCARGGSRRLGHMAAMSKMPEAASSSVAPAAAQTGSAAITRKVAGQVGYAVRPPRMSGSGWEIGVGPAGQPSAVGSLQMHRNGQGCADFRSACGAGASAAWAGRAVAGSGGANGASEWFPSGAVGGAAGFAGGSGDWCTDFDVSAAWVPDDGAVEDWQPSDGTEDLRSRPGAASAARPYPGPTRLKTHPLFLQPFCGWSGCRSRRNGRFRGLVGDAASAAFFEIRPDAPNGACPWCSVALELSGDLP